MFRKPVRSQDDLPVPIMMFETLDARRLFTTLAGNVFTDADSSTTFDSGESGVAGTTVFIDASKNGRVDTGETTTTTDADGNYQFKNIPAGTYTLGVVAPAGTGQTAPGPLGADRGGFDITLVGLANLDPDVRAAFQAAADRWESIIVGDLPDVGTTDDVRISVAVDHIDGPGNTLAQSGPTRFRTIGDLPYAGEMEFDSADISDLLSESQLTDTVTHEMAHVLGFGTVWDDLGLIQGEGTRQSRFTGKQATAAYDALFNTTAASVPLETGGGDGTADSHWPESSFKEELMTGYAEDAGVAEPLSTVTVAQFADLGYTVDLNAADAWNPFTHATTATTAIDLGGHAFERTITVGKGTNVGDLNFGYRADTAPTIGGLTVTDGTFGGDVTLTARHITDAEGDAVAGVSFYGESNGKSGLQTGRGGDAYLGSDASASSGGLWTATAATTALAAGQQAYYAVATDSLGLSGRLAAVATLNAPPAPTRPNPLVETRQSNSTALLQWKDRSTDEIGFRVELLDADGDLLKATNVPADTTQYLLVGLQHATFYSARVRSYGFGGASAYTRVGRFRV